MLASALIKTGLLQFGLFIVDEQPVPYTISLQALPSHPQTCQIISTAITAHINPDNIDRIVAPQSASIIAGIVSYHLQIPLVYSQGREVSPIHDWIGSYDVGHPACLIVNQTSDITPKLIAQCKQVGLTITQIIGIIDNTLNPPISTIPITTIAHLSDIITDPAISHLITPSQLATITRYQTKRAL